MKFKLTSDGSRCLSINQERINAYCSKWKPGTIFDLDLVRRTPRKSDPMRKWYFAEILPKLSEAIGYEVDEEMLVHEQLKATFFKIEPDSRGICRNVPHMFADESTVPVPEKKKFVDWVIRTAAKNGAYIEDPR